MLFPLPDACPQLQQLSVIGHLGYEFFLQLGSRCRHLNCPHAILGDLSANTLQRLGTLLPNLTTLHATPLVTPYVQLCPVTHMPAGVAACMALNACRDLLAFHTRTLPLTSEMWLALPEGLTSLSCVHKLGFWAEEWDRLPSLRTIEVELLHTARLDIAVLAGLVAAAKIMATVSLSAPSVAVDAGYSATDAEDLQFLQGCIEEGTLRFMSRAPGGSGAVPPVYKLEVCFRDNSEADRTGAAMSKADRMQHVIRGFMSTHMDKPLHSFTKVKFTNEGCQGMGRIGDLSQVSRVFPNIEELSISDIDLDTLDMEAMVQCTLLRQVSLNNVDGISISHLRLLCRRSESLRGITLYGCRGISLQETEDHLGVGVMHGVEVDIQRGDRLEEQDRMEEEDGEDQQMMDDLTAAGY